MRSTHTHNDAGEAMTVLSSPHSRRGSIALLLLIFFHCARVASPWILTTPAWIHERSTSSLLITARRPPAQSTATTKNQASKESQDGLQTPTRSKISGTSKSKAKKSRPKEIRNGAETDASKVGSNAKKRRKQAKEPSYWRNETDAFLMLDDNFQAVAVHNNVRSIEFQIRGNPRPLRRHRTARGFMYNPSSKFQQSFRKIVQDLVWTSSNDDTNQPDPQPLFPQEDQLAMKVVFYMKRPKAHFIGGKPGLGRLRPSAPGRLAPTRTDVDNLAKFVLDSLNGLIYVDDRQVASIHATKVYDNDGHCEGLTHVSLQSLAEEDADGLLSSTMVRCQ